MSSRSLLWVLGAMRPGSRFVIEGAGFEAAVQDADQAVGELAEGGVAVGAAGSLFVVVGAGSGRGLQRGECLGGESVDEPVGVHVPGRGDLLLAGGAGDGAGRGVVLAGLGGGGAGRGVRELGERPAAGTASHVSLLADESTGRYAC